MTQYNASVLFLVHRWLICINSSGFSLSFFSLTVSLSHSSPSLSLDIYIYIYLSIPVYYSLSLSLSLSDFLSIYPYHSLYLCIYIYIYIYVVWPDTWDDGNIWEKDIYIYIYVYSFVNAEFRFQLRISRTFHHAVVCDTVKQSICSKQYI